MSEHKRYQSIDRLFPEFASLAPGAALAASLAAEFAGHGDRSREVLAAWLDQARELPGTSPGPAAEAVLRIFPDLGRPPTDDPWPILGLAPEYQRQARDFAHCHAAWCAAVQLWQQHIGTAAAAVLEDFHREAASCPDTGPEGTVELAARCLERHHRRLLEDPDYMAAQKQVESGAAGLREAALALIQPLWDALGLATRSDLLGLRQRQREELREVRRELAELRQLVHRRRERATDD
ncbi:MAG: hypothetical protein JJT90_01135 [Ectothiorhodospiraceae bacterium]|nr:hypothetical protein [Ectothiorhodospiraceae bacterium]